MQLYAQEVRIQEIALQESYAHYSQFLVDSEFDVRIKLDRQRDVLHELEANAEAYKGQANVAEEKYLQTEMDATRLLHAERDALQLAAAEHRQARHHAHQVLAFAGLTEQLQGQLELTQKNALDELTQIVAQGRFEIHSWSSLARNEHELAVTEARKF